MVKIISAIGFNGSYAIDGKLPWPRTADYAKADMNFFKSYTMGKTIIMGYETWKSLGKPLPNREHVVISRTHTEEPGAVFYNSLQMALDAYPDGIVIGGADLIREICTNYMDRIDEVVINRFNESFPATKYLDTRCIPLIHKEIKYEHFTQLRYFRI